MIRLLLGELEPDAGTVRQGTNLEVAYFDQLHATLDPDKSVMDNVGDGSTTLEIGGKTRQLLSYSRTSCSRPTRRGRDHQALRGERNRLLLARLFARPSNVLVLDEPTNDLDVQTLEVLEKLLIDYPGTVLIVSHDREFLDLVATRTLVLDGTGTVGSFAGGYSDWLVQSRGAAKAKKQKSKSRGKSSPTLKPSSPQPALDKQERKDLRELPLRIEKLEAEQAALHEEMADPAFFKRGGPDIAAAQTRLADLTTEIATAYERWEALEAKRTGS